MTLTHHLAGGGGYCRSRGFTERGHLVSLSRGLTFYLLDSQSQPATWKSLTTHQSSLLRVCISESGIRKVEVQTL